MARFYKLDCEELLHAACGKFIRRFRLVEQAAAQSGQAMEDMDLKKLDKLWEQAKHEA